ncbi:MAG: HAD family hydrolase [Asgard group archaeon]|nr:HAD family hydrolase [Asgard group archaeon]
MGINTILFDLDSTLNTINEMEFSRKYFTLLHNSYFSDFELQFFCDTLTDITRNVMLSKNSRELNAKKFMKEISKHFKKKPKKLFEDFRAYYANEYTQLEEFVNPAPFAKETVKIAFDKGYDVIIATTPIFLEHAINLRIGWSGVSDFDYKLITHAENMCSSKPREEYYVEILKKVKKKPSECFMVGNEFLGDIVGPTKLAIKTFYCPQTTTNDLFVSPELKRFSKIKPTYQGTMKDLKELIINGFE